MSEGSELVGDRFKALGHAVESAVDTTVEEHRERLGELHQLDADLRSWDFLADGETTRQLEIARRELALAEYCAAGGLYRQAYASLRLFLELSFAAVHFSAHEFERRRWAADKSDFTWSRALDPQAGVLSGAFVEMFSPTLASHSSRIASDVASIYRNCSQFIHGKATATESLPEKPEYSEAVFVDWFQKARSSAEAVLFLLLVRYSDKVSSLTDNEHLDVLAHRFGHYREVRALIGLADG